ncbi:hypothetical protein BC628DRAFT_744394 [Trametes gibbosa]|nr:hypothetical protein BC628DRAFT_744394 [Trametes gibbosa]
MFVVADRTSLDCDRGLADVGPATSRGATASAARSTAVWRVRARAWCGCGCGCGCRCRCRCRYGDEDGSGWQETDAGRGGREGVGWGRLAGFLRGGIYPFQRQRGRVMAAYGERGPVDERLADSGWRSGAVCRPRVEPACTRTPSLNNIALHFGENAERMSWSSAVGDRIENTNPPRLQMERVPASALGSSVPRRSSRSPATPPSRDSA